MKKKKSKLKISMLIATIVLLFIIILSCCLKCKVTFVTGGNEIYKTIVVNRGETIKEPDHPEKEGHTFCGWYVEENEYDFNNPIKESVKLEASWCVNEYEVTIKTGTGSIINNKIKYNEKLSLPNDLTKAGYNFLGWFSNGDKVDSNTKVTSDMTVEGIWAKKDYTMYTVEHYYMDRDGNYPSTSEKEIFTVKTDSVVTPNVKNKKGYTSPNKESIKVLCDGKNVIKYYYPINSYNLTVQGDIGISDTTGDGTYFYGDKVEIFYTLKPGYSFVSYSENIEDSFYIVGEEDVIIYITTEANTNTKYTVEHYQMDLLGKYSDIPTSFDILEGTTDTKVTPKVNDYEGFTSPKSEEVIINGDESTVVKYYYERNKYELHVVASTGIEKAYGNGTYYYGDKVTVKADVKNGYTFDKWSNGNTNVTFEHTIGAQNKAIIARATVNVYDITYNLNNGVANNPASYTVEEEIELSIPERLGYTFVKWKGNNVTNDGKIAKGTIGDISVEAIWKTNNYPIQYNLNGATLDNKPTSYTVEDEITLNTPIKTGYTFVKWKGNNVTNDGKIAKGTTGDITVEAIFKANNYTVVFDKNGATSGVMSSQSFTYDEYKVLIENNYVKTGYTFTEWNTNKDGSGTSYVNEEEVSNLATTGTITLYAQWTANTYTIEYNSNLGTGTMPIQLTKYDLETTLYKNTFERIGYTFSGWNTKVDGTGTSYANCATVSNLVTDGKIILYAQWKANIYTIKFDANTGIGTVDPQVFTYDVAQNINVNTFNKTGYTFSGWNTASDGTGMSYENQEEVINLLTSGSITLYARWTANSYIVQFNSNTGTGTMEDQTFTYDVKQNLNTNKFERLGYTFSGWNTKADGTGTDYNNNEIVSNLASNGKITLYAQWKANTYRIEFDANTGTGTMEPQWVIYDRSDLLDTNGFTKNGYTFSGWNTAQDGTGIDYNNQANILNIATNGTVTLYAMWDINTYTIEYHLNGGSITKENPTSYTVEDEIELSIPERLGYTFVKWEGNGINNNGKILKGTTENIVANAVWKVNNYNVIFNVNGGIGTNITQTFTYDVPQNLIPNTFTKTGYTFSGWNTKVDGTGTSYDDKSNVNKLAINGNITLYAMWIQNTYTVEFNANGGIGSMPSQTHTYDDTLALSENKFTKVGYTFSGWNTASDGSGTSYVNEEEVSNLATTGTITLYAQWTANTYTIEYNSNLGTGTMPIQLTKYDLETTLYKNTFERVGYTFLGWNTKADGTGTSYANGATISNLAISGTVTLYAKWTPITYTITYNLNGGTVATTNPISYTIENEIILNAPTKKGYTFTRWTGIGVSPDGKIAKGTTGNVAATANWQVNTYTIEYNLDGGTVTITNPTSYTIENEITLNAPTKQGYVFTGWNGTGVSAEGRISKGTIGNITVTANYELDQFKITFDTNGGSNVDDFVTYYGYPITKPNNPSKVGHEFAGWYIDNKFTTEFDFTQTMPYNDLTLYAKWDANESIIGFISNGGTPVESIIQDYGTTVDAPTAPTKKGYTFVGWYSDIDLTSPYIFTTMPLDGIVLYAKWDANRYDITYDANSGTGTMPTQMTVYDVQTTLYKNEFERVGYTFSGWNTAQDGTGTSYANQESVSNLATSGTVTLYANWIPTVYTIEYNLYGGIVTTANPTSYTILSEITLNAPTKQGYTFTGWNGTGVSTDGKIEIGTIGNITATALYTPNTYTVEFNTNSGIGSMSNQTHTYDGTKVLSSNSFTRVGYTFSGWNTKPDGSGTSYANAANVSNLATDGTITLYAQWTANTYTVEFNANGGTGTMPIQTHTYDGTKVLSSNSFTRVGYTFSGWNTKHDGSGTSYANQSSVSNLITTGTVTLYAQWTPNTYTVEFISNSNNVTGTMSNQIHTYDDTKLLSANVFTKEGYTFTGWNTASDGSGTSYANGASVSNLATTGTITLYAQWTANTYTVEFNSNGGIGTMSNQTHTYDKTLALSSNTFTRVGYTFAGWNTKVDGSGTSYENGATVSNLITTGTIALYAQWTPNTYTVEFNSNGGTGTMSSQTHTYDRTLALSTNAFTRVGYTFAGWNTKVDGSGTSYENGATVSNLITTGTIALYAQWTANTYTVEFNSNSNNVTGTMGVQSFTYGVSQNLSENVFEKTGYTFAGWNTEQNGSGIDYSDEELVRNLIPNGKITLYAKWRANTYTVIFNPNGGSGSNYTQQFTYNELQTLNQNQFNKSNYTFNGWNTKADGTGTNYVDGASVSNLATSGTVTLYAQWRANTYTVIFNPNGGSGSMNDQVFTYDVLQKLSENTFAKVGYTFVGWNTASDGSGTTYANLASVNNISNGGTVTLYAQWHANHYNIEYNANLGTGIMPIQMTAYNKLTTLYENIFERVGYTFSGWNTKTDGTGISYENGATVSNLATSGTVTLYAKWTPISYTITYNLNGGTVTTTNPTSYTIDDEITLNAPTKKGYIFNEWVGTSVSTDGKIAKGTTGNITVTATYTPNTYTVEFNSNGGIGSISNQTFTYDISQNLSSNTFTRVGYTFAGWNTKADGTGTSYANQESVSNLVTNGNVTLYAKWTPIKYSISYTLNGGTVTGNPTSYTIEDEITLKEPSKKDYKLIKWIINGNDSNGVIPKGTTGNLSIEAVYGIIPKIESLSFDVYKDENGTEPYYSDGQNNSIYVGNGSFYMKLPRDAFIDIYSIGFTTNTSIYLNPESKDIEGDKFFDISATKGGKGSKNGTIDFNIELGLAVDIPTIDVAATNSDATKWRSTKQTKYLQGVKFFFQVLSSNNLAFADGLAKSSDDISSPRYISYRQDVQNNTFIFFAPVGTTRTSITYVKDNITLATINYIPIGSSMPDMGEYQLPGYKFEGWYLDQEFTKPYDTSAKVEKSIKVYGKYKELDIDNSWYDPAKTSYDVCGKAQLKALASIANTDATFIGKTINLTCNTDLGNEEWIPITGVRTDSNGVKYFEGTFNGNGYKIKNLKITTSPNTELGFFGATRNSTIKNVIFDGVTINSGTSSATAAAVGYAYNSHAYQVLVKNATINGQTQTAGIFGRFTTGSIKESAVFDSNITSSDTDTGSAGASLSGTITIQDFYSNATIKSNASAAPDTGGIIGSYTNGTNALTMKNVLFTGKYSVPKAFFLFNTSGAVYGRIGATAISGGKYDNYSGSMDKSTWLFDKTILGSNSRGTGKTTTQLKNSSTYSESVWSRDIWVIDGANYPQLKWITLNQNIDA